MLKSSRFPTTLSSPNTIFVFWNSLAHSCFVPYVSSLGREDHEVFRGVIQPIAVNMMNNLTFDKRTSKHFFGDDTMDVFTPQAQINRGILGFVLASAQNRSVETNIFFNSRKLHIKSCITVFTICRDTTFSIYRGAFLRTKLPFTWFTASFTKIHGLIIHNVGKIIKLFSPYCLKPAAEAQLWEAA